MIIPVLGMDPSLRHWGLLEANLNLSDGILTDPIGSIVEPIDLVGKNIRVNSNDLHLAQMLGEGVIPAVMRAKAIFVECPVGSQSARAMASYGIIIGLLGAIRASGFTLIEVSATESKRIFTGNPNATKKQMITKLIELYPNLELPRGQKKGTVGDKAEHIADAMAAIHTGVVTPTFQTLLKIMQGN